MTGQTIPISTAEEMIRDYYDYMTNLGVNMEEQTQSVSFTSKAVLDYLNNVMASTDELRVFMGSYPPDHGVAGRTTVILWPYRDGQPATDDDDNKIEPFNEGHGNP